MATPVAPTAQAETPAPSFPEPLLEPGDRLTRDEFERRYNRMRHFKKAELVEGTVFMPSPVRAKKHAEPHNQLGTWLGTYSAGTPGTHCFDNSPVRLDLDNEPQPALVLIKTPAKGGQVRITADDCLEGPPELAVEIVGSSSAYDLHQKKGAYRRNGVFEYLAWITGEQRLAWWQLHEGEYRDIVPDSDALLKSRAFPGLWLDAAALLKGDMKTVLAALRRGFESPEHRVFIAI